MKGHIHCLQYDYVFWSVLMPLSLTSASTVFRRETVELWRNQLFVRLGTESGTQGGLIAPLHATYTWTTTRRAWRRKNQTKEGLPETQSAFSLPFSVKVFPLHPCERTEGKKMEELGFSYYCTMAGQKWIWRNFSQSGKTTLIMEVSLTFGLLPPIDPGLMDPVSWKRVKILLTQPWDTSSWRDISQGRTPRQASSTIFRRI